MKQCRRLLPHAVRIQNLRGIARHEEYRHLRVLPGEFLRQITAIEIRHDDVGYQQLRTSSVALKKSHRLFPMQTVR